MTDTVTTAANDMSPIESTLLQLEQRGLDADASYDAKHFDEFCAEDFVAVGSFGVYERAQVIAMYTNGTPAVHRKSRVTDPTVRLLGEDGALVTYTLVSMAGDTTASWYATTVYRRTPLGWRIVHLHQTPVAQPQS